MRVHQYLLILLSTLFINAAQAEPFFEVGFEGGGDTLVKAGSDSIDAGGGLRLAAGIEQLIDEDEGSYYRLGLAYISDDLSALNGSADISTLALDGLYLIKREKHSFGAGATMHLGADYSERVNGIPFDVEFDNAVGLILHYGYDYGNFELTARLTNLTYSSDKLIKDFDAGGFGIGFLATF